MVYAQRELRHMGESWYMHKGNYGIWERNGDIEGEEGTKVLDKGNRDIEGERGN
jgi:hypothetical protein